MAETRKEVQVTELVLSLGYQFEALVGILEKKGILSRDELLEEIKRLHHEHKGAGT